MWGISYTSSCVYYVWVVYFHWTGLVDPCFPFFFFLFTFSKCLGHYVVLYGHILHKTHTQD